uniref:Uncharacterized protein n=1 Tax=Octopus bimaculoides TaxID=37653 RepID=A0A0L8HSG3_OCTBM
MALEQLQHIFEVKADVYKSVALTTLLYSVESWTQYQKHINQLDAFHMQHLHTISSIKLSDHIHNSEVLTKCSISGIETILIKIQLR